MVTAFWPKKTFVIVLANDDVTTRQQRPGGSGVDACAAKRNSWLFDDVFAASVDNARLSGRTALKRSRANANQSVALSGSLDPMQGSSAQLSDKARVKSSRENRSNTDNARDRDDSGLSRATRGGRNSKECTRAKRASTADEKAQCWRAKRTASESHSSPSVTRQTRTLHSIASHLYEDDSDFDCDVTSSPVADSLNFELGDYVTSQGQPVPSDVERKRRDDVAGGCVTSDFASSSELRDLAQHMLPHLRREHRMPLDENNVPCIDRAVTPDTDDPPNFSPPDYRSCTFSPPSQLDAGDYLLRGECHDTLPPVTKSHAPAPLRQRIKRKFASFRFANSSRRANPPDPCVTPAFRQRADSDTSTMSSRRAKAAISRPTLSMTSSGLNKFNADGSANADYAAARLCRQESSTSPLIPKTPWFVKNAQASCDSENMRNGEPLTCNLGDEASLYGSPKEDVSPVKDVEGQPKATQSMTNALKDQIISFFQPSDNKLAMKLFGNKKALMKEKQRQKAAGNWVVHPCSNFRFSAITYSTPLPSSPS